MPAKNKVPPAPKELEMKYQIVEAESAEGISQFVNILMSNGWKPVGGVSVHPHSTLVHQLRCYQAMVRD